MAQSLKRARVETPNPLNGFTTPSIATDGVGKVFAFIPEFGLAAYESGMGRELWAMPIAALGGVQGIAVSPVYFEGRVYLNIDTPEQAWLGSYSAGTGKLEWKVERPMGTLGGYSTPAIWKNPAGKTLLIAAGANELTGNDIKSGERVWWVRGATIYPAAPVLVSGDSVYTIEPAGEGAPPWQRTLDQYDKNKDGIVELAEVTGDAPSPVIWRRILSSIDRNSGNKDGKVTEAEFNAGFATPDGAGGLVRTKLDNKGDATKTAIQWRYTKGVPYVTAPVLYKDLLWVVRNGGIMMTLDPATDKVVKEARLKDAIGEYYAQPVAGGDHVYFINKDGKISVTTAKGEWEMVSSGSLEDDAIATPAISGGRIYIRTDKALWCFAKG